MAFTVPCLLSVASAVKHTEETGSWRSASGGVAISYLSGVPLAASAQPTLD